MHINIKTTNFTLDDRTTAYVREKMDAVERFLGETPEDNTRADIELGRTTRHHRSGSDVFRAEINLHLDGAYLRAVSEGESIAAALDEMKDEIIREITSYRSKRRTLLRRGQTAVKQLIRGIEWKTWKKWKPWGRRRE